MSFDPITYAAVRSYKMKKTVLAVVLATALVLSGCKSVGVVQATAKYAVTSYCALSPEARAAVRVNIDPSVAPNQIRITCSDTTEAGDVQN